MTFQDPVRRRFLAAFHAGRPPPEAYQYTQLPSVPPPYGPPPGFGPAARRSLSDLDLFMAPAPIGLSLGAAMAAGVILGVQHLGGGTSMDSIAGHVDPSDRIRSERRWMHRHGRLQRYQRGRPGHDQRLHGEDTSDGPAGAGSEINGNCVFVFAERVPGGLPEYGITISHRGTLDYDEAEMLRGPSLVLGN